MALTVEQKVISVIYEHLGCELSEVTPSAKFGDGELWVDSLDGIQIAMSLEEVFDIEIPDEDMKEGLSVQDVIDYVKSKTWSN